MPLAIKPQEFCRWDEVQEDTSSWKGGIKKAFPASFGAFVFLTMKPVHRNFFIETYMMTEKHLVFRTWSKIGTYVCHATWERLTATKTLRVCLLVLGTKAQKSQQNPRSNALLSSCKRCFVKHLRASRPNRILNMLPKKDTNLYTYQGILSDADYTIAYNFFPSSISKSGCEGLSDSINTVNQPQYSYVDSFLSDLMSYLYWCPYDGLSMDTMPLNHENKEACHAQLYSSIRIAEVVHDILYPTWMTVAMAKWKYICSKK